MTTLAQPQLSFADLPPATWGQIREGMARVPTIAGAELQRAFRAILFTFFRRLRAQLPFRGRGRFALSDPRRWPITVRAAGAEVSGKIEGDSAAATLHEVGGRLVPRGGGLLALPVGLSLTRDGRRKKHHRSPADRTARGVRYVARVGAGGAIYLHELRPVAAARRGRPRKNAAAVPTRLVGTPSWLLVRSTMHRPGLLGWGKTLAGMGDQVQRSMGIAANATLRKAFRAGVYIR